MSRSENYNAIAVDDRLSQISLMDHSEDQFASVPIEYDNPDIDCTSVFSLPFKAELADNGSYAAMRLGNKTYDIELESVPIDLAHRGRDFLLERPYGYDLQHTLNSVFYHTIKNNQRTHLSELQQLEGAPVDTEEKRKKPISEEYYLSGSFITYLYNHLSSKYRSEEPRNKGEHEEFTKLRAFYDNLQAHTDQYRGTLKKSSIKDGVYFDWRTKWYARQEAKKQTKDYMDSLMKRNVPVVGQNAYIYQTGSHIYLSRVGAVDTDQTSQYRTLLTAVKAQLTLNQLFNTNPESDLNLFEIFEPDITTHPRFYASHLTDTLEMGGAQYRSNILLFPFARRQKKQSGEEIMSILAPSLDDAVWHEVAHSMIPLKNMRFEESFTSFVEHYGNFESIKQRLKYRGYARSISALQLNNLFTDNDFGLTMALDAIGENGEEVIDSYIKALQYNKKYV